MGERGKRHALAKTGSNRLTVKSSDALVSVALMRCLNDHNELPPPAFFYKVKVPGTTVFITALKSPSYSPDVIIHV